MSRLSKFFEQVVKEPIATAAERASKALRGRISEDANGVRAVVSHVTTADQDIASRIRLSGTTLDGTPMSFRSDQVKHQPLVSGDGTEFGVLFSDLPEGDGFPSDAEAFTSWARGDRHSDHEVFPRYVPPDDGHGHSQVLGDPEKAAWADAVATSDHPPAVAVTHGVGDGKGFAVDVNTGSPEQPQWTTVVLDGASHGRLLESIDYFARAAKQAPATILVSCKTAMPGSAAAREAADYLHSSGTVSSKIHAPTDLLAPVGREPGKITDFGVVANYDSSGKPLPLFDTFSPPENRTTPWHNETQ